MPADHLCAPGQCTCAQDAEYAGSLSDAWRLHQGHVIDVLRGMPAESVNCVVTSPPYWSLRKYDAEDVIWGGEPGCAHAWRGQYGLEPTPDCGRSASSDRCGQCYVCHTLMVLRAIRRVLRSDGTVWWNISGGYAGSSLSGGPSAKQESNRGTQPDGPIVRTGTGRGLKPKDMDLMAERIALAAQADGWWVRSRVIVCKRNPMPESVKGSHGIRHRVTIEEYEELSRLREAEGYSQDGASDLSELPPGQVPARQGTLPAESEGPNNGARPRRARGRARETTPILGSETDTKTETDPNRSRTAGITPSGERSLQHLAEGESQEAQGLRSAEGGYREGSASDGRRLVGDRPSEQEPMPLLPQASPSHDGSRDPAEQGRQAREGEHRSGLSELQRDEEGQADPALIDCPGCDGCEDGWLRSLSAGRPTDATEHVWMLTKSPSYWYDDIAVRDGGHNLWNYWLINTTPSPEAHFATFGLDIPMKTILASCPREVCARCGKARVRLVERRGLEEHPARANRNARNKADYDGEDYAERDSTLGLVADDVTVGWSDCGCGAPWIPGLVLDPFAGLATTGLVALRLGRRFVGIELSEKYADMARAKLSRWWTRTNLVEPEAPKEQVRLF